MNITRRAGMIALALVLIAVSGIVMMLAQTETAHAEEGEVTYLDENGFRKKLFRSEYTDLTDKKNEILGDGWFAVKGNVTITGKLTITGETKIILCNGAKLTVNSGIILYNTLSVYGDSANPEECGMLFAVSGVSDPAIGNIKASSKSIQLVVNSGYVNAWGKSSTIPAIGGPGFTTRINGGTVKVTGRYGIGAPEGKRAAKLYLGWNDEYEDSIQISHFKNVDVELVDDFLYDAPGTPEHDTVAFVPLIEDYKLIPAAHRWRDVIYKVICKEGTSVPEQIEVSAKCFLCHRTDVEVKPVITEVMPNGVIHYYTEHFENPDFGYWEFYDDGKGDAVVLETTPVKKTIKASTLKKKTVKYNLKTKVLNGNAKSFKYQKSSGNKKITVSKAGKVTVKKGLKKGTYKLKVKVTATLTNNEKESDVKTIKVVVK